MRITAELNCTELSCSVSAIDAGQQIKAPLEAYRAERLCAAPIGAGKELSAVGEAYGAELLNAGAIAAEN
jgi:hypothetical protein